VKITIRAKRQLSLGADINCIHLKVGVNQVDKVAFDSVKDKWFVKALVSSGAITVDDPSEVPEPEGLAEVVITKETIEVVMPEIEPDKPAEQPSEAVEIPEAVKGPLPQKKVAITKKEALTKAPSKFKIKREG
jgi:hypothetical protein